MDSVKEKKSRLKQKNPVRVMNKQQLILTLGITTVLVTAAVLLYRYRQGKGYKRRLHRLFDSPDLPGSGKCMDQELLDKLHRLARITKLPIFAMINSGARSEYWNKRVGGVANSSHKIPLCKAVDIKAPTIAIRNKLVYGAKAVGITRIGVGKTFVHVDTDHQKKQHVAWGYPKGSPPPLNPFI